MGFETNPINWLKNVIMQNFQKLKVWHVSRKLAKEIYLLTEGLPNSERFGLKSQIRRCVISISSNIAEGSAKTSKADFSRFLEISLGSCFEMRSQLILCHDLDYLNAEATEHLFLEIENLEKQISSLISRIRSQIA